MEPFSEPFPAPIIRRFLTTFEAASYLGLARRSLERMRIEGSGPAYIKLGRLCRYAVDDLDRWAESRRRTSTRDPDSPEGMGFRSVGAGRDCPR